MYLRCKQKSWDPTYSATIRCISFGAPTCGNAAFAEWYDRELGVTTKRVYCLYDIAAYVWDSETLKQLLNLYDPYISMPLPLTLSMPVLIGNMSRLHYRHVRAGDASPAFVDQPPRERGDYVSEICVQHIRSYLNFYEFQPLVPFLLEHVPLWKDVITKGELPFGSTLGTICQTVFS